MCDNLLHALFDQLRHAERQLTCADMIDNSQRRAIELDRWESRVANLKRQIDDAETVEPGPEPDDVINLAGSGPVPVVPREG